MEVSSPIKPTTQVVSISKFELGYTTKITGQVPRKKPKAKVQLKKIAREKGKAKELVFEEQLIPTKRTSKLIFEEEVENLSSKKRCTKVGTPQPTLNEISAVTALQHHQEQ